MDCFTNPFMLPRGMYNHVGSRQMPKKCKTSVYPLGAFRVNLFQIILRRAQNIRLQVQLLKFFTLKAP